MKIVCCDDFKLIDDYLREQIVDLASYRTVYFESVSQVLESLKQRSLFGENNRVIVKNCNFLSQKFVGPDSDVGKLVNFLEQFCELDKSEVYLISKSLDLKSSNTNYALFPIFNSSEVVEISNLTKSSVKKYIKKIALKFKMKLSSEVIDFLSDVFIPNGWVVDNELQKISLIYHNQITVDEIKKIVFVYSNENMFKLLSYIIHGDYEALIKFYGWLVNTNVLPNEILAILLSQLFMLKSACSALASGLTRDVVIKKMHLPLYFFKMWGDVFSRSFLNRFDMIFDKMSELEIKLKKGEVVSNSCILVYLVRFCGMFAARANGTGGW